MSQKWLDAQREEGRSKRRAERLANQAEVEKRAQAVRRRRGI